MNAGDSSGGLGRIGRIMVFGSWVLAAGLMTWAFSGLLDWQHNPNTRVQTQVDENAVKQVVLKRNRYGHYVANGRINGHPVEFLLDTGATHVAVPVALARRLQLEPGVRQAVQTANGVITTYAATLDSVELGDIELNRVAATINPHSGSEGVLLGMAFLKHLELIQRGDTLTIRQ